MATSGSTRPKWEVASKLMPATVRASFMGIEQPAVPDMAEFEAAPEDHGVARREVLGGQAHAITIAVEVQDFQVAPLLAGAGTDVAAEDSRALLARAVVPDCGLLARLRQQRAELPDAGVSKRREG